MNFIRITLLLATLLILSTVGICQTIDLSKYRIPLKTKDIALYHLNSDTLFKENQSIILAEFKKEAFPNYQIALSYADTLLKKTSTFGEETGALVALNGGFFDVEKGGSVSYLESEGKTVAMNRDPKKKWAKTDSLLNGAIVMDNSGNWKIEISKGGNYYMKSDQEKAVLVSGPILLLDGQKLPLESSAFVMNRHPRSCMCKTFTNGFLFIAVDGRSKIAAGMNLNELQQFLLKLNCKDAINLDGGGSTTLWVNDGSEKTILNHPSDLEGERPVANILLIKKITN